MKRAHKSEFTHRINAAMLLVKQGWSNSEITTELSRRFGVSKIQAYRYLHEARDHQHLLPIPEKKSAFTVKLPHSIIVRIKGFARQRSITISDAVKRALEEFLQEREDG